MLVSLSATPFLPGLEKWADAGETYFALPYSMKSVKCVDTNLKGDIDYADNFIVVDLHGNYKKGDTFRIILKESPSSGK